jgi:type IV pilus assembly protein PilA
MKRHIARAQRGFTLIELMIVVAIIGILAAIAIPQYQDYVTRARWQDNITSVGSLKQAIAECAQNNNNVFNAAPCNSIANLNTAGFWPTANAPTFKFAMASTTAATVWNGTRILLDGTGVNQLSACTVTLTPTAADGVITWTFTVGGAAGCGRSRTGVGT